MYLLRTLGSAALFQTGSERERHQALASKRLALLVFLARAGPGPFLRRDLPLALLWPELDQAHGRGALRQALYGLRRQLGPDLIRTEGEEEIGLAPDVIWCDATEFERIAVSEPARAVALYHGDFLAGFHAGDASVEFEEWVAEERRRLRQLAVRSAWAASDAGAAEGRPGEALRQARRAVDLAPDDEAGAARLIALLDRQGDRSGALEVYDRLVQRLSGNFGVEPTPETRQLVRRIRLRNGAPPGPQSPVPAVEAALPPVAAPGPPVLPARRHLLWAGVLGAVVMLGFVIVSAWMRRIPIQAGDLVGVMPFRVNAVDSSFSWLREGMVELLSIRLTGEGGMKVAEPGRLITAWRREIPAGRSDVPEDAIWRVAGTLGIGRIVHGSVTGDRHAVSLSAWILAPGGRVVARASAEGSSDSLPSLIDRLAVQLLSLSAGIEPRRLAPFASTPLPAIRAFLAGRTAFRTGRMQEAQQRYREAIDLDSSFALAGLELYRTSVWTGSGRVGWVIANAGRRKLSGADRAWLDVMHLQWVTAPVMFAKWRTVTEGYPDRPESWYGLGDAYYHWGALAGLEDHLSLAEDALRRGWRLDSTTSATADLPLPLVGEPTIHLVELAHLRHDTAEVRRLVARVLAADPSSELAFTLRWHLAVMQGDSARNAFWRSATDSSEQPVRNILLFATWTGIGAADLDRLAALSRRSQFNFIAGRASALNGGRPSEVPTGTEIPGFLPREALRSRIRQALSWGGDSGAARAAVVALSRYADGPLDDGPALRAQYQDICTVGQWRAALGDVQAGEVAARRLHEARIPQVTGSDSSSLVQSLSFCAALLDATRAASLARPDAHRLLAAADSLARSHILEVCCGEAVSDANLLLARLWEREGAFARALQAVRRRAGGFRVEPLYLSTFLREEGRLAGLTGDTAAAVRAYRHYLALRPNPEPSVRPEVERVRRDLAALSPGR